MGKGVGGVSEQSEGGGGRERQQAAGLEKWPQPPSGGERSR